MEPTIGAIDQAERDQRDEYFAYGPDHKRTPALLAQFAKACTKTDTRKCEQKCPARQIRDRCELRLSKKAERCQQRDQQESEHKLWKLPPQELRLVADG